MKAMKLFAALLALTLSLAGCGPVDGSPVRPAPGSAGQGSSTAASGADSAEPEQLAALRQLAGEEGSHARRLMGVYYLVTGCCYQPRLQGGRVERLPWREVLRTRYHAETCGGLRYAQAAEVTEDVCLREIWEELSAAEYRHARQLLSLLEQMVLA